MVGNLREKGEEAKVGKVGKNKTKKKRTLVDSASNSEATGAHETGTKKMAFSFGFDF